MSKSLVVYFSRIGEQYGVGNITEGNTAKLAKIIASKTGSDIFEIRVVHDEYPEGYSPLVEYAKKEKQEHARPEIMGQVENLDEYDTIYLGYPNWWGDMPMPVYTFIENSDLSGKKIHHFCTHEGSGALKKGDLAVYGHTAQNDKNETERIVEDWLKNIG